MPKYRLTGSTQEAPGRFSSIIPYTFSMEGDEAAGERARDFIKYHKVVDPGLVRIVVEEQVVRLSIPE